MNEIIIFGIGSFAEVAQYYFTNDSKYRVVAFTVNECYIEESEKFGLPVLPFETIEKSYPPSKYKMFVAIGYSNVNKNRAEKYYEAKKKNYELISYICSRSVIWQDLKIGDNCFIFENQTIQPFVTIGNNVIIWSGSNISHNSNIGDHCFIASHVVISGNCVVEPFCFLGANAILRDGIRLARETVLGAGAIITKNTVEKGIYYSSGANIIKKTGKSDSLKKI